MGKVGCQNRQHSLCFDPNADFGPLKTGDCSVEDFRGAALGNSMASSVASNARFTWRRREPINWLKVKK
jgi:hypothetical protein